jgi:glutaconate CoA-transferase, subunit B
MNKRDRRTIFACLNFLIFLCFPHCGPSRVITDKAIFDFEPESKRMRLVSIHPNTTLDDVLANMSFKPIIPANLPITEPPTAEQVALIRDEIDPNKDYAGG